MELWFTERYPDGWGITFKIRRGLFSEESRFQRIDVLETENWGRLLVIDGAVMLTERDEFAYHEMLVHVPLFSHPGPERVLIIGGGDGGAAREVLRHRSVREVDLVEIDKKVIEVSKKYFPDLSVSFSDERLNVVEEDGISYVKHCQKKYDVILVDSTDPVGPAVGLFEEDFYRDCFAILTENGLLCTQSGSPYFQKDLVVRVNKTMKKVFPVVKTYLAGTPSYGGLWSFAIGSKKTDPSSGALRTEDFVVKLKYYNYEVHKGAFGLPNYLVRELD